MRRRTPPRRDRPDDIHRQNVQKARAMARMDVYDRLTASTRDVFKIRALPVQLEPREDDMVQAVEARGGYFDARKRLVIPGEGK